MTSNKVEQGRAPSNGVEHDRPLERRLVAVERQRDERDRSYLAIVDELPLSARSRIVIAGLVRHGFSVTGGQRQLSERLGVSSSTVCLALSDLAPTGLVTKSDGAYRLDREQLVAIYEVHQERASVAKKPLPGAALDALENERSRALDSVRGRSTPYRTVTRNLSHPVTDTVPLTVTGGDSEVEQPRARSNGGDHKNLLKADPAWQALQTDHFRRVNGDGSVQAILRRRNLTAAFDSAVAAGLAGDDHESRVQFLAAAIEVAESRKFNSPAVILRRRVEMGSLWRTSRDAHERAKKGYDRFWQLEEATR